MIIVNNLCDFHDLYTSLSLTFVKYFNGRNKDIYFFVIIIIIILLLLLLLKDEVNKQVVLTCACTKHHATTAYTGQRKPQFLCFKNYIQCRCATVFASREGDPAASLVKVTIALTHFFFFYTTCLQGR